MTRHTLIFRYSLFAVLATLANLMVQRLVLLTGDHYTHFMAAVALGTIAGLVLKYILDKNWIFYDQTDNLKQDGQKFVLYTVMGLVTTAIFWGTETTFWLVFETDFMREVGAVFGLTVGYVVKYNLDRRFVFTDSKLGVTSWS